jgi:hypothetical protein
MLEIGALEIATILENRKGVTLKGVELPAN